jgi:hypothetical protein
VAALNNALVIKDILLNLVGEYQSTTPPAVQIDVSNADVATSVIANIGYGISTLDIAWIAGAILLIVAFVCVIGLIRAILSAIVR